MKLLTLLKSPTPLPLVFLCAWLISSAGVFADDTADALKALQAALEKESAQKKPDDPRADPYGRGDMGAMFLGQLRSTLARGESVQWEEILNQLPAYLKSEAVRQAADQVRAALTAERTARDQALAAQIEAALTSATNAVRSAQKAADLDETLSALSNLQQTREDRASEKSRAALDRVRSVRQFAVSWQDYLASRDAGNAQKAVQSLQNASNDNTANLIPRSEILAKIEALSVTISPDKTAKSAAPEKPIREILEKTKTLDAISAALEALDALYRQPGMAAVPYENPITLTRDALAALLLAYREHQAGLPAQLELRSNPSVQARDVFLAIVPLRLELLRLAMPRILHVDETLKIGADETVQKYLDRVMDDAMQRADAVLIGRVRQLQETIEGARSSGSSTGSLATLLAAQHQEEAQQFVPAVISYQAVLRIGGELVPAKAIGARLDAIKMAHPEDFAKAMQIVLSNPTAGVSAGSSRSSQPGNTVVIPGAVTAKPSPAPIPAP